VAATETPTEEEAASKRGRRRENPEGVMTLWEHLGELRTRLIRSAVYVAVAFGICFIFLYEPALKLISAPYLDALGQEKLLTLGLIDTVSLKLKVVTYMAVAMAMPFLVYEIWAFVSPGLTKREKRWSAPFIPLVFVFFCFGVLVGYLTLPPAIGFMLGFAGDSVEPFPFANQYLSLVTFMLLAFGLTFEFPLVLILLQAAHAVSWRALLRSWRYVIIGITIFAAVITPSQDPYSLTLMVVPMVVFYFGSILFGWLVWRDRGRVPASTDDSDVEAD
jgi:sec-independent protein translocase protein TatC